MKPEECYTGLRVVAKLDGHEFEGQVAGMIGSQALVSPMEVEDWMKSYLIADGVVPVLAQYCELSDGTKASPSEVQGRELIDVIEIYHRALSEISRRTWIHSGFLSSQIALNALKDARFGEDEK